METVNKIFYNGEDYEKCYFFAPSISHKKNVGGNSISSADTSTAARTLKKPCKPLPCSKRKTRGEL